MECEKWIRPDGSLVSKALPWLWWNGRSDEIALDGSFTIEELEWLAAYMKSKQATPEPPQKGE